MKVYVAGPYTHGDVIRNIRNAVLAGQEILEGGHTPFIPHMNYVWHFLCPGTTTQWYDWDNEWLKLCDAVIRLPGYSRGSDLEVELAHKEGIPVYDSVKQFLTTKGRNP